MDDSLPKLKIILARPSETGRSDILLKYFDNQFQSNYKSVVGIDFFVKKIEGIVELLIWDISPQIHFAAQRRIYFQGASGAILVFNCTELQSWQLIQDWYAEINQLLGKIPFILLGIYKESVHRTSNDPPIQEFQTFALTRDGIYIETSSVGNLDLNPSFLWLVNKMLEKIKI